MAAYRFRVTFEDYDDIYRDIELKPSQTFYDFHEAITKFISFDTGRASSFFISDDNWIKGREITSRMMKENDVEEVAIMDNAVMRDFIADPHQKIYYIYDHDSPWSFRIELIKIVPADDFNAVYPRCVKSIGDAPKQFIHITDLPPEPEDFEPADDENEESGAETEAVNDDEIPEGIDQGSEEDLQDDDKEEDADDEMMDSELPEEEDEY